MGTENRYVNQNNRIQTVSHTLCLESQTQFRFVCAAQIIVSSAALPENDEWRRRRRKNSETKTHWTCSQSARSFRLAAAVIAVVVTFSFGLPSTARLYSFFDCRARANVCVISIMNVFSIYYYFHSYFNRYQQQIFSSLTLVSLRMCVETTTVTATARCAPFICVWRCVHDGAVVNTLFFLLSNEFLKEKNEEKWKTTKPTTKRNRQQRWRRRLRHRQR